LRRGEEREQCDKSGEQSVGAEDFVFHGGGVCEELAVGGDQIADGKWRMSEDKLSSLRAENDIAAEIVVCARAGRRKPPAVAVRNVGLRPVMTGAKVRSDHANDKSFNVKLS
jgi:hypothetical protein